MLHDRDLLFDLFLFDVISLFLSDKSNQDEVTTERVGKCSFLYFCFGRRWVFLEWFLKMNDWTTSSYLHAAAKWWCVGAL